MTGGRRRKRLLGREEAALWREVAKTIEPLPGKVLAAEAEPAAEPTLPAAAEPVVAVAPSSRKDRAKRPPPLAPVEDRLRQRLLRGRIDIDRRLDLHGMRQAEAHGRLLGFLDAAQAQGAKVVLIITGKGKPGAEERPLFAEEPGVLRRAVPHWLSAPELRGIVLGFEEAGPAHGGAGALYVRLRRRRR